MNCQCCGGERARLTAKNSELIKGNKLVLCTGCKRDGHEPRYIIVLASVSGVNIRDYVVGRRYCGAPLDAHEVIH